MDKSIVLTKWSLLGVGAVTLVMLLAIFLAMQINAHEGDEITNPVHACANKHSVRIVDSNETCKNNETAVHLLPADPVGNVDIAGNIVMDGGAIQFDPAGSPDVLAMFRGGPPTGDGVFLFKRFGDDHTILHINSPPCGGTDNCLEATLALVRGDEPNLELVDFYNNGYPSETQYGIRMIKRGTGSFRDFVFDYFAPEVSAIKHEVMRITPPDPNEGTVSITGYIQLDLTTGSPPAVDCNSSAEEGRMKFDPTSDDLYICSGDSGWVSK